MTEPDTLNDAHTRLNATQKGHGEYPLYRSNLYPNFWALPRHHLTICVIDETHLGGGD